jgi:hypothetical protein
MAEKTGFRSVKKGNFGKQMEFRKKSTIWILLSYLPYLFDFNRAAEDGTLASWMSRQLHQTMDIFFDGLGAKVELRGFLVTHRAYGELISLAKLQRRIYDRAYHPTYVSYRQAFSEE